MEKAYRVIFGFFVIFLIVIAGIYFFYLEKKNQTILFYGENCYFCKEVDEFIKNNSILDKIELVSKEIENNPENKKQLENIALFCGITSDVRIPFLYVNGQCFQGKDEVVAKLNSLAGAQ